MAHFEKAVTSGKIIADGYDNATERTQQGYEKTNRLLNNGF